MNCPDFEDRILDWLDNRLSAADRHQVESHVATCAACRRFWLAQQALDARLAAALPRPVLSGDFRDRVLRSVQALATSVPGESREKQRQVLEADLEVRRKALWRACLWRNIPAWLDLAAYITVAIAGGLALCHFAADPKFLSPSSMAAFFQTPFVLTSLLGSAAGLIWSWGVATRSEAVLRL